MTDQLRLFRGPLTRIRRCKIKVGGGRLYADYRGTVTMRDQAGNSILLSSVLYVPKLGVNLLSGKRMCEKGLQGSFDHQGLYMRNRLGKLMLEAPEQGGVYVVKHIAKGLNEFALLCNVRCQPEVALAGELAGPDLPVHDAPATETAMDHDCNEAFPMPSTANPKSRDQDAKMYELWHRRFAHIGSAKLRDLHKVTTLSKPIPIVKEDGHV